MVDLAEVAGNLNAAIESTDPQRVEDAGRKFVEEVTFATAEEILTMLRDVLSDDWMALPPWARNLAYRLACLQRPHDAALLREAAADLLCFGPDWDDVAEELQQRAARLDT